MITLGCDVGSLFSKAVVMDGDDIIGKRVIATTGRIAAEVHDLLKAVMQSAGISADRVDCLGATGNGAALVKGAAFVEDTITCAGAAAGYFMPEVRCAIDVGGQSITSIAIDEEGGVRNFMRNDKCASGSGRFLEMMSAKLGVRLADVDKIAAGAKTVVEISSQCGVFAESEVITHVNNGENKDDILAGVCSAVAKMVSAQGRRFGAAEHFTLLGGVARIDTVTHMVRRSLGGHYHPFPFDPQLATAIGAALLGDSD